MSSTKSKETRTSHRYRKWMGAATAAALVAGSATMTMAAPRGVRADGAQVRAASFQWQTFTPKHIVRYETSGAQRALGNVDTEALRAPTMTFVWQAFVPPHFIQYKRPNGSSAGAGSDDTQMDALRLPASFTWQKFVPVHFVQDHPARGSSTMGTGDLHTDAMRSNGARPSLVLGVDRDGAGGVRADLGVSFRLR